MTIRLDDNAVEQILKTPSTVEVSIEKYDRVMKDSVLLAVLAKMIRVGIDREDICKTFNMEFTPSVGDRLESLFRKHLEKKETGELDNKEEKEPAKDEDKDEDVLFDEENAEAEGWQEVQASEIELPKDIQRVITILKEENPDAEIKVWTKKLEDKDPQEETGKVPDEEAGDKHFIEIVTDEAPAETPCNPDVAVEGGAE